MIVAPEFPNTFQRFTPAERAAWLRRGLRRWITAPDDAGKIIAFEGLELKPDLGLAEQLWLLFAPLAVDWTEGFAEAVATALSLWSSADQLESFAQLALLGGKCRVPNLASSVMALSLEQAVFWSSPARLTAAVRMIAQGIAEHSGLTLDGDLITAAKRLSHGPFAEHWRPENAAGMIERLARTSNPLVFRSFSAFRADFVAFADQQPRTASAMILRIVRATYPEPLRAGLAALTVEDVWVLDYLLGPSGGMIEGSKWQAPLSGRLVRGEDAALLSWRQSSAEPDVELSLTQREAMALVTYVGRNMGGRGGEEADGSNVVAVDFVGKLLLGGKS